MDLSIGVAIQPGSVLATGKRLLCDEQFRASLLEQATKTNMTYLSRSGQGDADVFYGPKKIISDSGYGAELLTMLKYDADHPLADLFPGAAVVGLPRNTFRTRINRLQVNCTERKIQERKYEYYDRDNNLMHVLAPTVQPVAAVQGSPLALMADIVCGAAVPVVDGTYEGINTATYKAGGQGDQKIWIVIEQNGVELKVNFKTSAGQGKGVGKLLGTRVQSMSLESTAPECPGSYDASFDFASDALRWSFKGQDCGGQMEGHGTATRTKA